jgi:hypothetical protein
VLHEQSPEPRPDRLASGIGIPVPSSASTIVLLPEHGPASRGIQANLRWATSWMVVAALIAGVVGAALGSGIATVVVALVVVEWERPG